MKNYKLIRKENVKARDVERNKERKAKRNKPALLGSIIVSDCKVIAIMNGAIYAL